ncbi:MAG: RDD family protein, partial [Streptosporangiaceae bacterium]
MTAGMQSGLVTGEAVELDLRIARLASRAAALLIDLMIMLSLFALLSQAVQLVLLVADEAVAVGLAVLITVGCLVGYPVVMETSTRGRTVGKMALGLRTVSDDGGPVRFRQALIRGLAGFAEFFMFSGAPALITSLVNRRGKRLGDIFAGTIVIQDRVSAADLRAPVAQMPPQLAGWAQGLELSQLSDDLALSARQYLLRFWELLPEVRDLMGARLAGEVAARVSPPPPPGLRPEILLSAVLAERRRREEYRL